MPQFVHLHVHTQYSILDGQASVQRLVDKAMADGQPGIAVTDHGDMFGIKEFYNYVQKVKGKCKDKAAEAEARIAALRLHHQAQFFQRRPAGKGLFHHGLALRAGALARQHKNIRRQSLAHQ